MSNPEVSSHSHNVLPQRRRWHTFFSSYTPHLSKRSFHFSWFYIVSAIGVTPTNWHGQIVQFFGAYLLARFFSFLAETGRAQAAVVFFVLSTLALALYKFTP